MLIVGGGFSGLLIASFLGDGVVVFEEHGRVGRPEHCAGIISSRTARLLRLPKFLVEETFNEMKIFTGSGALVWRGNPLAVKVDRVGLEQHLYHESLSAGAEVKLNFKVTHVSDRGFLIAGGEKFNGEVIVLAEGASRLHSRNLNLISQSDDYYGLQAKIKGVVDCDCIEVYLNKFADGFFSWFIPLKDKREAIIGLASKSSAKLQRRLLAFQKMLEIQGKLRKSKLKYFFGGTIIRGVAGKIALGRIVGIGDCIQMTKPLSGGGLYPITIAAKLMADKLNKLLNSELDWKRAVGEYCTSVKPLINGLRAAYIAFRVLGAHDYLPVKIMAKGAERLKFQDKVMREFDYDNHISSLVQLLLNPSKALKFAGIFTAGLL